MGKNSDSHNIFNSYLNKVILKESNTLVEDYSPEMKAEIQKYTDLINSDTATPEIKDLARQKLAELEQLNGTMTPDQAKQVIASQQAQNATPSQGTVEYEDESSRYKPNDELPEDPAKQVIASQQAQNATTSQGTIDKYEDESSRYKPNDELPEDPALASITAPIEPAAPQKAPEPAAPQKAKIQSSGGGSIVDYLNSIGQASDKASRAKLAAEYGIQNYDFSAGKNTELLKKLQSGEKPSVQGTEQAQQSPQSGGISKTIGGAGNAIKKGLIGSDAPLGGALGAVSKGIGGAGNIAKGAVGGASKAIGGAGNLVKKGLIGSDAPLGGALGAVSKGLGSVGNVAKNAGNIAKGAVGGASKAIGGAGNLAKQGLTGQKEPMGGILGGISKGLGSIGNVAKRAVGGGQQAAAPQKAQQAAAPQKAQQAAAPQKAQAKGYTPREAGVDEFFKDEAEEYKVNENKNISNFLRSLSNKDYSKANKYLKNIIENKINHNILKNINNKY